VQDKNNYNLATRTHTTGSRKTHEF